ncbi:siderophore-interacting protein [Psychrobacter urativorans]|uniref:siderophore-interacting protein n=1 Tax=Psychrobacter urativorans TaxID=45610 RepID=UPI00191AAD5D|nr:siderophore-interacting protein [Psychrobacter urativorans]
MKNTTIDSLIVSPVREVMRVSAKQIITPHYIRVYLTAQPDTIANIAKMTVGFNNKILIPTDKTQPVDIDDTTNLTKRTYTHRGVDITKQHIWIDFVAHGDQAPASSWVSHAQVGDQLAVLMTPKNKALYPAADHFLLVGDATAIPVLGAILESLPSTATVQCIIEVYDEHDQQHLPTLAKVEMTWLHNRHPEQGSQLANTVKSLTLPTSEQSRFAYVASEFSSVKAIRHYLKKELDWSKDELYAFSYWKAGIAEDRSAKDRLAEKDSE